MFAVQENVHFKLLQDDVKRNEVTADMMRVVGSMAPERKRWRGLLESLYWNAAFDAPMQVFRLLQQIVPVMREWQHFNEFDFQDMPDFDSRQIDITPARENAPWPGSMLGKPHGAVSTNNQKWENVTLPEASQEEAFMMLMRAVLAQIQVEADAYGSRQSSHDPGDDWLCNMGKIMAEQVRWAQVAWAEGLQWTG